MQTTTHTSRYTLNTHLCHSQPVQQGSHDNDNPTCAMQQHTAGATGHNNNNPTCATQQQSMCNTATHPSVPLTTGATGHDDDNPTHATQQHIHLCTQCPGMYNRVLWPLQHNHDDATQPHNAPACCTTPQHVAHPHLHTIMAQPQAIEDAICPVW
ncbi:hypothetical protein BU15DRAFT_67594 [Melanogaster broomeanus]|nr:hypothetical protein BU15DRAFT_67594 [Melanogaster broomeanus]